MKESFSQSAGRTAVDALIAMIHQNRGYLSEIDGAIGDGDHGINMDKGFTLAERELASKDAGMSEAFTILGRTLVDEIGGSMGPLYGTFFKRLGSASRPKDPVDSETMEHMLVSVLEGLQAISPAKPGDKTLMDTLVPGVDQFKNARADGKCFADCLDSMIGGAEKGWQSTKDMEAKLGRASRLGERSRGVLDAGATSCYLIIKTMGETMKELLK
ncbi:dihydroxyacetone kinase subunit DhaL [Breznakiella homolactica]|uniref:Dihydroxyacetone kinase subunit L n=1 Tax=Breznakiella homolactica TaxID=2798577 RepID=A0A7T7XP29_9SPIR|nr:dihydroxyacetone kinase subunit DhaL [Breznakiella homolactica]QQO09900.1 dihydroxyacetone kinase subunit L [Breznakiella homolactica]